MEQLSIAIETARVAGEFLHKHFGNISTIERKADKSLVTNLDKEAEQIILERFRAYDASYSILSEEIGSIQNDAQSYQWIIDPLDGTHNFIRGNTMYGVSIGLAYKGEVVAGAIYLPESHEMYAAEKGGGAFKNNMRISVSDTSSLSESTLLFDSGFHYGSQMRINALSKVAPNCFNVRVLGASSRNLTYLAEGKADVLVEFDEKVWDFAAGMIIIKEAGGRITEFDNSEITLKDKKYVASNGRIHESVLALLS